MINTALGSIHKVIKMNNWNLILMISFFIFYILYIYLQSIKERFRYFLIFSFVPLFLTLALALDFYLASKPDGFFDMPFYVFVIASFLLVFIANLSTKNKIINRLSRDIDSLVKGILLVNSLMFPLLFPYLKFPKINGSVDISVGWYMSLLVICLGIYYYKDLIKIVKTFR
jgi:hypothetical protein